MPVSSFAVIPYVIDKLTKNNPKTVLDLGVGNGMYGNLVKNYLPNSEVFGIEAWSGYRSHMWDAYNSVIIGDIIEELPNLGTFDFIIMADVIEHFEKTKGREVVDMILSRSEHSIISTPDVFCEQGAVGGNEYETHKSLWKPEDLPEYEPLIDGPCKFGHIMQVYYK